MARSERFAALVIPAMCAACTVTGLGDYTVGTCTQPNGTPVGRTSTIQAVAGLDGPQIAISPGSPGIGNAGPVAAFLSNGQTGCVEAVDALSTNHSVQMGTCILQNNLPQQPYGAPLGQGYAFAAVLTSPNPQGQLTFFPIVNDMNGTLSMATGTSGAMLPSVIQTPDGSAFVAWYERPLPPQYDPIQSCTSLSAAPLVLGLASAPGLMLAPTPTTLTMASTSVGPAAMAIIQGDPGGSQLVIAAPDGQAAGVWAFDSTTLPGSTVAPTTISGFAQARAVSLASDGKENLAVVAELGCTPQTIALALGTLSRGFHVTTVAPANDTFAVEPSVAWAASEGYWIVSWISGSGGAHALAKRFDRNGNAVGAVIDPGTAALAASVTSDATLFAYQQPTGMSGSFVSVGLGCAQAP